MYFFKSLLLLLTLIGLSGCGVTSEDEKNPSNPTATPHRDSTVTNTHTNNNGINKSFNGEWRGQGVQSSGDQWTINIDINSRTQKYTISYPSLNCGGELTLLSVDDEKIELNEKITYGDCTDHGKVVLVKRSEDKARYIWYFQNGTQDAWGEVERNKNKNIDIDNITGVWKGTYTCSQGLTALELTIKKISSEDVEAIFNFSAHPSNPNVPSGSYKMLGEYTTPHKLDLETYQWIQRPANYAMVGLLGGFDSSFSTYRGTVPFSGCTTFSLSKGAEKESKHEGTKLYKNFGVTTLAYKDSSNWDAKVQELFGSEYRVADWNDLVSYHNGGGDLIELYNGLGLTKYKGSAYVKRGGNSSYSTTRYYYASRHNHNKPSYYLAHENIDNHLISLGSWYGSKIIMAIRK